VSRAEEELEQQILERTAALRAANEQLQLKLAERARTGASLASTNATLSAILECSTSPIFCLDRECRYVAFNLSHATTMRTLYGCEIEVGSCIFDCMTVAVDREKAEANLDRALAGEHVVEEAYSGEEQRARRYFEISHHPIRGDDHQVVAVAVFAEDITERKRAETRLLKDAERDSLLLDAFLRSPQLPEKQIYEEVLELAVRLSDSAIGFLHRVSDDQRTVILASWSTGALESCSAHSETHYPIDTAGNWVDCVRFGRPVVYNDFASSPNQKGLPQGHVPLRRFMSVPVIEGDKIRIIFGVGNKDHDYDDSDVVQIQQIANELAKIISQRRAAERADVLNRLYRTVSEISQVIVREQDRDRLLTELCRIGVEHAQFPMVWVGLADAPGAAVKPVAAAGLQAGYADELEVLLDVAPAEQRPAARAILEDRVIVVDDTETDTGFALWREAAQQRGFRSCAAFPVHADGVVRGVLKVYASEAGVFHGEVAKLLTDLAADLGYALHSLEAREQRKQVEAELRRSNELLRVIIEAAPTAIIGPDLDGRVHGVWNPAAEKMLGWTAQEAMGRLLPSVPAESQEEFRRFRERIREGLSLEGVEVRRQRKDGTPIDYGIYASPLRDHAGKTIGNVAVLVDATERKRLAVELQRLAIAIEQAAETIVITDPDGAIEYVNPAFSRVTGYSRDEVIGANPRLLQSGKHDTAFYRTLWDTLGRGETWHGHFVNKRKDGTLFEEEATISPVRDEHGQVIHYVAVKRDVTQEVTLESQLRQSQKMEAVGRLAGGVAHDFNNLLFVITGHTDLLLQQTLAADPRRERLQHIADAASRAADLTRQLLAFSRRQVLEPTVLDLGELVRGLANMLPRLLGEDVDLRISIAPQLGEVRADAGQIEQVIMNLAVNARDAMPEGGQLTIQVKNVELDDEYARHHEGAKAGPFVMLAVSDSGCGMAPETQRRIFEPFFTTKELGKGTGLGLSTVYGVVKQSNGYISVYSEPGQGTTFKVYLPRVDGSGGARGRERVDRFEARGSETILLVEDDAGVRRLACELLQVAGYTVLAAAGGAEALAIAEKYPGPVDLLLTDVVMPGMSGRDLARRLAERRPETKVVFMSGYTDDAIVHHGVLSPGTLLLGKPFTPATLGRRVREALRGGSKE
jgi:two-component system cell cycle sensor histidine kinase/response regulator CckA